MAVPEWIQKGLASIGFIAITIALITIALTGPATGYELSVFSAYPAALWVMLIVAMGSGVLIIILSYISRTTTRIWLLGFFLMLIANLVYMLIQVFRGYYVLGLADPLAHYDNVATIAISGSIGQNYYPGTHILGAIMLESLDLPLHLVMKAIPVFFSLLFSVFIYLLSRETLPEQRQSIISAMFGMPLFMTYYQLTPYPHALALMLFPLALFLYFKYSNNPSPPVAIALLLVVLCFPLLHPVPELIFVASILSAELYKWLVGSVKRERMWRTNFTVPTICVVSFLAWVSQFSVFHDMIERILGWEGDIARRTEIEPLFSLDILDTIILFMKMYGHIVLIGILALASLAIIIRWKSKTEVKNLYVISIMLLIGGVLYGVAASALGLITWGRVLGANPAVWALPVLGSFFAGWALGKTVRFKKVIALIICAIILLASCIGFFSAYRSPWIQQPNWQITEMDLSGSNWLDGMRVPNGGYAPMGWMGGKESILLPSHFGYPDNGSIGELLHTPTYIVLTERFRQCSNEPSFNEWVNVPSTYARPGFNDGDFFRMGQDPQLVKVFSNSQFEIFGYDLGEPS